MGGKRGSFFSLDAIIAIFIIIFGIYVFFASQKPAMDLDRAQNIGNEVLDFLDRIVVGDICNGTYVDPPSVCACVYSTVEQLWCANPPLINSKDLTLLEVISEIYSRGFVNGISSSEAIRNLVNQTIEQTGLVPEGYDFYIIMNQYTGPNHTIRLEQELYPN